MIGGGATGIQFLFEIAHFLRRQKIESKLRLIHGADRVLNQFIAGFSTYTQACMSDLDIDFHPNTRYLGQQADRILLEENETGRKFNLASTMSLLFLGKKPELFFWQMPSDKLWFNTSRCGISLPRAIVLFTIPLVLIP